MAFDSGTKAIPKNSLMLVTGVTGFIGSHIAKELLNRGYRVRGTVRDTEKARWISELFGGEFGKARFETTVVSNIAAPGAFDEAVKGTTIDIPLLVSFEGVSGVVHVASILTFSPDPSAVIPATVTAVLSALAAAAKEQSVKRFVFTSSSAAITLPKPNVEFSVDENTWNDEVLPIAWTAPPYDQSRGPIVYAASKVQAEREAWQFVEKNKPAFVFNTVLPAAVFGEIFDPVNQRASTGGMLRGVFLGNRYGVGAIAPQYFVNVEDAALLHMSALLDPEVQNERIIAWAAAWVWNDIFAIMRQVRPDKSTIFEDIPNEGRDLSKVANTRGEKLLRSLGRPGWASLEDSVKATIKNA
ncbi:MAG: hypothetical protein M1839_004339 [Geoglossum umbratile]|nr:MAG: hypothetical protein M1839_004339 [Geoglossum umbratile]